MEKPKFLESINIIFANDGEPTIKDLEDLYSDLKGIQTKYPFIKDFRMEKTKEEGR